MYWQSTVLGKSKEEVNFGMSIFLTTIISEVMETCKIWGKDVLQTSNSNYSFLFYDGVIKNNLLTDHLKNSFYF